MGYFIYVGARRHVGEPHPPHWIGALMIAVVTSVAVFFTTVRPDFSARFLIHSLSLGVLFVLTAQAMAKGGARAHPARYLLAAASLLHGLFMLGRPWLFAFDLSGPMSLARMSAISPFILLESAVRPALESRRAGWVFRPLDQAAMERAATHLIGEHDFSSFRSSMCQSPTPVKTLREVHIRRCGPPGAPTAYWRFDFEGQAFLHHMIRNIMGCLVAVGTGTRPPDWVGEVLQARDRRVAAPTFAADGLYFLGPQYDEVWGLPTAVSAMDWLPA